MKRRIIMSTALVLSVLMLSLFKSDSSVHAQQSERFVSDTGAITLGTGQSLVITVVRSTQSDNSPPTEHIVQFRQVTYGDEVCNGPVCKQAVASSSNSGPVQLMPGDAATFRIGPNVNGNDVRGMVMSNSKYVKVNAIVFDTSTQRVVSIAHTTTTMYWP